MYGFGIAALAALFVAGCASSSKEIQATYVSPVQYQHYTCQQLGMEAQALSTRAAQVAGVQDEKRTSDTVATTAAIIIFWPAAFLVKGDGQTAAELANLKGQMQAVEQAALQKKCAIQFQQPAAAS